MKPYGVAEEANLITVINSLEALTESDHESMMKIVTWQLVKGDTQKAPLLSYQVGKGLGTILVSDAISNGNRHVENASRTVQLLEEYKDQFQRVGKIKGIQVDLNIDPEIKPVAQPPQRRPFSVREKMKKEIEHLLDQDIIEKVLEPIGWVSPPVVTPQKRSNSDSTERGHASCRPSHTPQIYPTSDHR